MRDSMALRWSPRQYAPATFISLKALPTSLVRAHVRAAAEIDPLALAVERDGLVRRQILDQLRLVLLALVLEEADRRRRGRSPRARTVRRAPTISRIFASMAGKSSGVNGSLRAKS